jgi:hypothetical protein
MSLPSEKTRAVLYTKDFLYSLLDPKKTPKVPKYVRDEAFRLSKHYPNSIDLQNAAKAAPDTFGKIKRKG